MCIATPLFASVFFFFYYVSRHVVSLPDVFKNKLISKRCVHQMRTCLCSQRTSSKYRRCPVDPSETAVTLYPFTGQRKKTKRKTKKMPALVRPETRPYVNKRQQIGYEEIRSIPPHDTYLCDSAAWLGAFPSSNPRGALPA